MSETLTHPVDPVEELDPVTVADKPREPTEYERKLRRENAAVRAKLREAETDRDAEKARVEATKADSIAEMARAVAGANTASEARIIRAELKASALAAGMVDLDGLKLLDLSAVTMNSAGDVAIPDGFFAAAKVAKPYLFGSPIPTTSTPVVPPPADPPSPKRANDMTAAEFAALKKEHGIRV